MDLYCQVCGEPQDFWGSRAGENGDFTEQEKTDFDSGVGCPACKWGQNKPDKQPFRSELASVLADILGDDIDGIASEMDDAEYMYGDKFWED